MDIRFFLMSSILTQTWNMMACSVLSLNWSHKRGASIRVSHGSRTREGDGSDKMHHFSQRCKWCGRYSCSQISYTHWLVPTPFVTLSQISWFILILASTFLTLNAACSLMYLLRGQALFSDTCVTSGTSMALKSVQWIQKVPLLAKMLSSDFK